MKGFRHFMWFEWKRFFSKRNIIVFGVFLLLALIATQYSVSSYKKSLDDIKKFRESEKKKIKHILNYRVYGTHGFMVKMLPAPVSIFFSNSVPFREMESLVDTSENLKIYSILQSNNVFKVKLKWFSDFSGIILIVGSFLAFLFGFESFLFTGYLKLLSSVVRGRGVFLNIMLSRAVMLSLLFLVALVLAYVLIALNGIIIPLTWSLPVFYANILLTILCFFVFGAFLGMMKSKWIALCVGILVWFLSIFAAPLIIEIVTAGSADSLASVYEMEINKMKILDDYQRKLIKKHGVFNFGDIPTEELNLELHNYLDNEFNSILKKDEETIDRMDRTAKLYRWLSVVFPTANYWAVNYELSGSGYESLLDFYRFIKTIKFEFLKEYMGKVYFSGKPLSQVEPFLKGDGNIFKTVHRVPWTAACGFAVIFIYIGFFLAVTRRKYQRKLFTLDVNQKPQSSEHDLFLDYGDIVYLALVDDRVPDQLFCLLSNKGEEFRNKGYTYSIKLDGQELSELEKPLECLHLVSRDKLPEDIKAGHFLSFLMRVANSGKEWKERLLKEPVLSAMLDKLMNNLSDDEYCILLTAIMNTGFFKIIVLADAFRNVSESCAVKLKKVMEKLTKEQEVLVIAALKLDTLFKKNSQGLLFIQQPEMFGMLDGIKESTEAAD